jgi:uncharacterized protein (TIGR03437 family)
MNRVKLLHKFVCVAVLFVAGGGLIFFNFTSAASDRTATLAQHSSPASRAPATIHGGVEVSAEQLQILAAAPARRPTRARAEKEEREEADRDQSSRETKALPARPEELNPATRAARLLIEQQLPTVPELTTNWSSTGQAIGGLDGGSYPPDTQIATSRTHVVVTANTMIGFYDKSGHLLQKIAVPTFFSPLNLDTQYGLDGYFDGRVIFDAYRNRFWLGSLLQNNAHAADSQRLTKFVVGVSKTENPLDGWYLYWWDAVAGDGKPGTRGNQAGDGADYPSIGVDKLGFYQTNMVCSATITNCPGRYQHMTHFPAAPLTQGVNNLPAGTEYWDIKAHDGQLLPKGNILQPAVHHGTENKQTFFAAAYDGNQVIVYGLSKHYQQNEEFKPVSFQLTTNYRGTTEGPQKDSCNKIQHSNLGNNVQKAVYRSGFLYLVMQDTNSPFGDGDLATVRFVRQHVFNFPTLETGANVFTDIFVESRALTDQQSWRSHAGWPAVEVNKDQVAGIVYSRTGANLYPEARYTVYVQNQTNLFRSRLLQAGEGYYSSIGNCPAKPTDDPADHLIRWGDLAGASVDPYDDEAIWFAQSYATTDHNYKIAVGKLFGTRHPDLIVAGPVGIGRGAYKPSEEVTYSVRIRNQGDGVSRPARYSVYLSTNTTISTSDRKVAELNFGAVNAGAETQLIDTKFAVPADLAPGLYYLGVVIDSGQQNDSQFQEYSTDNNTGRSARWLVVRKEDATTFLPSPGTKWHESFGFGDEIPRVGDFNGDGKDDIVAFNRASGAVFVALSDGTKFTGNAQSWHAGFSFGTQSPLVGDFNGDGRDDIATFIQNAQAGSGSREVYVAPSEGNKFGSRIKWHDDFSASTQDGLAAADVNGDGKDDVLYFTGNKAYVALSDGTRFGSKEVWQDSCLCPAGNNPVVNAVGDVNRDGKADLIAFNRSTSNVFVYLSDGNKFGAPIMWGSSFAGGADLPTAGDFNGDGRADIIYFTRGTAADVFTALSTGTSFKSPKEKWHDIFAAKEETPLVGDFNGDGADDIATFLLGTSGDVYVALARRPTQFASVSASSYAGAALAKESIVAAFGANLAAATQIAATVPLPTELAGTTVQVTDSTGAARLAPLFFVSAGQINYQIPPGTATGEALVTVTNRAGDLAAGTLQIANVAPGLFTANASGRGLAAAVLLRVRANGSQQFEPVARFDERLNQIVPVPIDFGPPTDQLFLIMYGAGFRFASSLAAVSMQIGGANAQVLYAGPQGGFVGLDQLNVALSRSLAGRGTVDIALTVDRQAANVVQVNFK